MTETLNGDQEAIALAGEIDSTVLELARELTSLFTEINNSRSMDRSSLKKADELFAKLNNLMSRLGLKKISGVVSETDISENRSKIKELSGYYNDLVSQIDNLNPASKDPKTMTIEEAVAVLERLVDSNSDYYAEVNQRFLELVSKEPPLKEAEYRCKRAFQAILAKGDTGEDDFGVWFPEITNQLVNKTTNFIDIGRYLFTMHSETEEHEVTLKNIDELPINEDALDVWDYVVNRIKGKYGGLILDPDNPNDELGKRNYDYNHLSGDNISFFVKHLKEKFSNIDEDVLDQLIKYCQAFDSKTTAYTAWLTKETTRSHGAGPSKLRGEKFEDPLFTVAFFAAGIYGRGRYGNVIPNNTSPDLILMPKRVAIDVIPENRDGSLNEAKRASSAALWDIVNSFYTKIVWRGTPSWIEDVRSLFGIGENEIDLYKTMFPMPGEVTVDAYKIELERRNLEQRHGGQIRELKRQLELAETNEERLIINGQIQIAEEEFKNTPDIKGFVEKWSRFGYGNTFQNIGIKKLTIDSSGSGYNLSVGQYDTSFRAMGEMSEFFHQPLGKMNFDQCVEKFKYWMDKIVGKAKLVPGRHYVLFPYLTMFAMDKIVSSYELRDKSNKVNSLIERLKSELEQAGGVPMEIKDKILGYKKIENGVSRDVPGYIKKDSQSFGVYPTLIGSRSYKKDLYAFKTRVMNGLEEKIRRMLPLGWGAIDEDDSPMQITTPWAWGVKVDKDTSGK